MGGWPSCSKSTGLPTERLLLQPHGFEDLLLRVKGAPPDQLARSEPERVEEPLLNVGAASRTPSGQPVRHDDAVSIPSYLVEQLELNPIEGVPQLSNEGANTF